MGQRGKFDRLALAAMLALAMQACLLCAACQQTDDDPVVVGKPSGTAQGKPVPRQSEGAEATQPVTQAEIDELWDALSEEDRELLTRNLQGRQFWESMISFPDPGADWDGLGSEERSEYESAGITRESYVEMRLQAMSSLMSI